MGKNVWEIITASALVLLLIFGLSGCYTIASKIIRTEYSVIIYTEKKSKSGYIQIKKIINSSCGCSDAIAEKYVNKKIVYRLYYGCSLFNTKKEIYSYCSQGSLLGQRNYDGTTDIGTNNETRLSPLDKFVIHKIDSFIKTEKPNLGNYKLYQKEINGFRVNGHP